jgi:hypothetical protein
MITVHTDPDPNANPGYFFDLFVRCGTFCLTNFQTLVYRVGKYQYSIADIKELNAKNVKSSVQEPRVTFL